METSESLSNLATSLAKAQKKFKPAVKDSKAYGYNYADMATVREAVIDALSEFELSVIQHPIATLNETIGVMTMLLHSSGEFIKEYYELPLTQPNKGNTFPQMIGSCITYYRRYALMAILGLAPEDDDGQSAGEKVKKVSNDVSFATKNQLNAIKAIANRKKIPVPNIGTFEEASNWIKTNSER